MDCNTRFTIYFVILSPFSNQYSDDFKALFLSFSHNFNSSSNLSVFIGLFIIFNPLYRSDDTRKGEYAASKGFNIDEEYPTHPILYEITKALLIKKSSASPNKLHFFSIYI